MLAHLFPARPSTHSIDRTSGDGPAQTETVWPDGIRGQIRVRSGPSPLGLQPSGGCSPTLTPVDEIRMSQRGGRNPARVTDTRRWTAALERWLPAPPRA